MDKQLEIAFNKCKIAAMTRKDNVFLTTIAFSLKIVFTDEVPTAAVDGVTMWINPDFFKDMEGQHRLTVYLHEVYHVAFQDMLRLGNKDPKVWNMATDFHHNLLLKEHGYNLPPGNWCLDNKYKDWSSKQIYDDLMKNPQKQPQNYQPDIEYCPPSDKEKEITISNTVIRGVTQSQMANEKPGTIPAEISRKLDDLLNPVMPWNDLLARFLTEKNKEDYSWTRPNKRFMPEFHLPSQYSENLDSIAVAIDASGSVTDAQFKEFLTEINYIQETMKPKTLTIIDFDTCIKHEHVIHESESIMDLQFTGGGGTNIRPVINWGIKNNPTVLIIFTDGEFKKYEPDIGFSLMWIINSNPRWTSKIGDVIYFD